MQRNQFFIALLALLVTGCSSVSGNFPSLERRAIESRDRDAAESAPPPAPVALSPESLAALAGALSDAQKGHDDFLSVLPSAQRAAAAAQGSAPGSENWSVAQTWLSELETRRTNVATALSTLDELLIAQKQVEAADAAQSGSAEIVAASDVVIGYLANEAKLIAAMKLE